MSTERNGISEGHRDGNPGFIEKDYGWITREGARD